MSRSAALLLALTIGLLVATRAAANEVALPSGAYLETVEDLRVKVMGGYVSLTRTWTGSSWRLNPNWDPLEFTFDNLDGSVASISRAGWNYAGDSRGNFRFNSRNNIKKTASGYRWEDRRGNWIEYDSQGKVSKYGDRNNVSVAFLYDGQNRLTGVKDHFDKQVLWYEYGTEGLVASVRDQAGRRVQYFYQRYGGASGQYQIERVVDTLGHAWRYTYTERVATAQGDRQPPLHVAAAEEQASDAPILLAQSYAVPAPVLVRPVLFRYQAIASRTDPLNHTTTIEYGANNAVSAITAPDGSRTRYGYDYDASQRLYYTRVIRPSGVLEEAWYNRDGRMTRQDVDGATRMTLREDGTRAFIVKDAVGNETRDEFDEWDNLTRRVHADGSQERWEHEPRFSNLVRMVDERGVVTTYQYDPQGNLTRKIEADGLPEARVTEYAYDTRGNLLREQRPADASTAASEYSYEYDNQGNAVRVTDPEGNQSEYEYDSRGEVVRFRDGNGAVWLYEYNAAGWLARETDPLGSTVSYDYDAVGNLVAYRDPRGKLWQLEYDKRDRAIRFVDPLGNTANVEYDADGRPTGFTDASGKRVSYEFDPIYRLRLVKDPTGNEIKLDYGGQDSASAGRIEPTEAIFPTYRQLLTYDRRNRMTSRTAVIDGEQSVLRIEYDQSGNPVSALDPLGNRVSHEYDALRRPIKVVDREGHTTLLKWDARDNLLGVTDAHGRIWKFEYDRNDQLTREIRPGDTSRSYAYDGVGNATQVIDSKRQRVEFEYDAGGRLTAWRGYEPDATAPARAITFGYDADANPVEWTDLTTSSTLSYDDAGRLLSETITHGTVALTYRYEYAANGTKTALVYPDGTRIAYRYDEQNALAAVDIPGEGSITVNAFTWAAPRQVTLPGGTVERYDYRGGLQLKSLDVQSLGGANLLGIGLEYLPTDQVEERKDGTRTTSFAYDKQMRLVGTTVSDGSSESFTLDPVGNRLAETPGDASWTYDESNRLTQHGSTSYSYDDNGSVTEVVAPGRTLRFVYDVLGRLTEVRDAAGATVARYGYDPLGRRIWKEASGTLTYFLYSSEGLIGEYDAAGRTRVLYGHQPDVLWNTDPLFSRVGESYFYFHKDHLGTPVALTDRSGRVAWTASYRAFGDATVAAGALVTSNLRYPGQYFDQETGLHYNFARYYDPATGRYLQRDPFGFQGAVNDYFYALGDPANIVDPTGAIAPAAAAAAAAARAAAAAYMRCVANCMGWSAAAGLLDPSCFNLGDATKDCAKSCLNPFNWAGKGPRGKGGGPPGLGPKPPKPPKPPPIKPGSGGGPTAGKPFPKSVKDQAKAENPTQTCVFCRREGTANQVDHAVPKSKGGNATLDNAQMACDHCNPSKGAGDFPKTPPPDYVGPWPPPWKP